MAEPSWPCQDSREELAPFSSGSTLLKQLFLSTPNPQESQFPSQKNKAISSDSEHFFLMWNIPTDGTPGLPWLSLPAQEGCSKHHPWHSSVRSTSTSEHLLLLGGLRERGEPCSDPSLQQMEQKWPRASPLPTRSVKASVLSAKWGHSQSQRSESCRGLWKNLSSHCSAS